MIQFGPKYPKKKKQKKTPKKIFINISTGKELKKVLDSIKQAGIIANRAKQNPTKQNIENAINRLRQEIGKIRNYKKKNHEKLDENIIKLLDQTMKECGRKITELEKLGEKE